MSKRFLLVRPAVKKGDVYNVVPPLGLGYLASALREKSVDVEILDCIMENIKVEDMAPEILERKPDIVGFQVFSYDVPVVIDVTEKLKSSSPEMITVIGGPHPSGIGAAVMKHMLKVDFAFKGEAENGIGLLVDVLSKNSLEDMPPAAYSEIPGLMWREGGGVKENPQEFIENLDDILFPAWDLIPPGNYPHAPQGAIFQQSPFAPIFITRGCPFPCTFCAGPAINGHKIRRRSIKNVMDEIQVLMTEHGVRELHILDDNFSMDRDYVHEWCNALIEQDLKLTWCCPNGMRLDTLDPELVRNMKKAGCYYISVGIESGSDRILKHMKKGFTVADIKERVSMIRAEGLDVNAFFIIGYPAETREDIEATIKLSLELDLTRAAFLTFLPLPGAPIFGSLGFDDEQLEHLEWDKFFQYHTPFSPEGISPAELKRYQRKAHTKFYFRPKIAWRLITELKTLNQLKYVLRRASKVFGAGTDIIRTEKPDGK